MRLCLSIFMVFIGVTLSFADVLSVKEDSVEIRDSSDPYVSRVVLVAPKYYPLSTVAEIDGYWKVSDFLGREGWVEKSAIAPADTVVVKVYNGNIRNGPGTGHEILFRANQGVAFKVLEEKADWLKVEHESGKRGWINEGLVWGL